MVDSGAIAADYYMVAILNNAGNNDYSTRAANAAYCVASENKEAFNRYHSALFAQQPEEGSGTAPDNNALIETARQAGVVGGVPSCINSGKNDKMVDGLAAATKISATPTIRLNGEDISPATPDELLAKVKAVVGNVPGLQATPTPPPGAPAPAPAGAPAPAPAGAPAPAPAPKP